MNLQLIWTKKRLVYTFIYVTFKVRYTTGHSHTALYFNKKSIKPEQCEHCDMWIKQIHQNRNGTRNMKTVLLCKNSSSFDLILSYENTYESHNLYTLRALSILHPNLSQVSNPQKPNTHFFARKSGHLGKTSLGIRWKLVSGRFVPKCTWFGGPSSFD